MDQINIIALSIVGFVVGFVLAYFVGSRVAKTKIEEAEGRKKLIIEEAGKEASALKKEKLLEVKEEWHKSRQEFEAETQDRRKQIKQLEHQISQREEAIENKLELITRKEKNIQQAEQTFSDREEDVRKKSNHQETKQKKLIHCSKNKLFDLNALQECPVRMLRNSSLKTW